MNENKNGTYAEPEEKTETTDVELDRIIEEEVENDVSSEKYTYKITRRKDVLKKNSSGGTLVFIMSMVMITVTLIMALTVAILKNLHLPGVLAPDSTIAGAPSNDTTSPTVENEGLFGTVESDYRSKPFLPTHKNAVASDTAYKPTGTPTVTVSNISSSHAILVDSSKGEILCGDGIDDKIQIASMTKVMTLIVACDLITDDGVMYKGIKVKYDPKMNDYATCYISTKKSKYYESTVYVIDLLYGLILESGADCAYALAEGLAGSEEAFVSRMNAKAEALGMTGTNFTNCVGKDDGGENYSTLRDVVTMFSYALDNPLCRAILTSENWVAVGDYAYLYGTNGYIPVKSIVYEGIKKRKSDMVCGNVTVLGGKSGNEYLAGFCLVSLARSESGREYICATAGGNSGQQYNDAVYIYSNYVK